MKLAEILARDVKEWLYCWVSAVQDSDGEVWFNLEDDDGPTFDLERISWISNPCHSEVLAVASDFQTSIVTRAQWEAERARIAELDRGQYSLMTEEAEDWRNNCQKQYEQEMWDKVAARRFNSHMELRIGREYASREAFDDADAFMAERAKRLKR